MLCIHSHFLPIACLLLECLLPLFMWCSYCSSAATTHCCSQLCNRMLPDFLEMQCIINWLKWKSNLFLLPIWYQHHWDEEFEYTHICCHMQMLFTNLENFKSFFPDFFVSCDEEFFIHDSTPSNQEDINREDQILSQTKIHGGFNKEKGILEYASLTMHKPKEMMNEHLVNCTEEKNDYIHSTKFDRTTGLLSNIPFESFCNNKRKHRNSMSMWYKLSQRRNIQGQGYFIHMNRSSELSLHSLQQRHLHDTLH